VSTDADFVYDDTRFILLNPDVRDLRAPWDYLDPATAGPAGTGIYRPLRTLSFALDHALFGTDVRPWRIESVLLHGLAAALLAVMLATLTGSPAGAVIGGLVFGFHPATAEVSSWLSSRGDVLALIGGLLAMLLHLRGRTLWAALAFGLGCLAKEMILTLPALMLLVDGARGARPLRDAGSRAAYATYGATAVAYLILRGVALGPIFAQKGIPSWPTARALGFLHELRITVFPVELGFDLQLAGGLGALAAALVALGGLAVLAMLAWRAGARFAAAGLIWFPVALLPVSVLPLNIATADRFLYVSLVGVSLIAADLWGRLRPGRRAVLVAGLALLCLGILGARRTAVYANPRALWTEALRAAPDNPRAIEGIAYADYAAGRFPEAVEGFRRFLTTVPEDAKGHLFLAKTYLALARGSAEVPRAQAMFAGKALAEYREAIELWKGGVVRGRELYLATTCAASARLALAVGDPGRAEADARDAIEAGAGAEGTTLLVSVLCQWIEKGRSDDAERVARRLLALGAAESIDALNRTVRARLGPHAPRYEPILRELARRIR